MSFFQIGTDSTADLPLDYINSEKITVFHLSTTIKGETYDEEKQLDPHEFYEIMRAGEETKTSQVNPDLARVKLLKMLENGKDILFIAFSSGLSGTFNSVRLAAEEIMEEQPDAHIIVVDSKCASMGEGLLVYKAVLMRNSGSTLEDTAKWVVDHHLNMVHMFTVDDLDYLYRGGRVSKSAALLGTVLNIKPILHVDDEGHLVATGKVRGRKKALLSLVDGMEERIGSFRGRNDIFFVSHCDCLEDALFVKDEVSERFGIESCMVNYIGPTIGAHSGPGTVALFFMGDKR